MFILKHQDGDLEYEFKNGGYHIEDSKLYISIETTASKDDTFPDSFLFAIAAYPLSEPLKDIEFNISEHLDDRLPNVYVYTTFYSQEVKAQVSIKVSSEPEIEVQLSVVSDDVNYYNDQAKPNEFSGSVILEEKSIDQIIEDY